MKLLVDTQCWLWWFAQPERLSEAAIAHIADESNELWFSVASVWEIGIKVGIGKLPLPEPIDSYISSRMVQLGAQHNYLRASAVKIQNRKGAISVVVEFIGKCGCDDCSDIEVFK